MSFSLVTLPINVSLPFGILLVMMMFITCSECNGVHYPTQRRSVELGVVASRGSGGDSAEEERLLDSEEHPLTSSQPT